MKKVIFRLIFFCFIIIAPQKAYAQKNDTNLADEQRYEKYLSFNKLINGVYVKPNWLPDGNSFWYAGGKPDSIIIYEVNPELNTKKEVFDVQKLRIAFKEQVGDKVENKGIPFVDFNFINGERETIEFSTGGIKYLLHLKDYKIIQKKEAFSENFEQQQSSADQQNIVFFRDNNIWLRSKNSKEVSRLTTDGVKDFAWNIPNSAWSPDGKKLFLRKSDSRRVHHIPIINYSTPTEGVERIAYAKTGGSLEIPELYIVDIETKQKIKIDTGNEEQYIFPLGWKPDGSEVIFMKLNRQANKLQLLVSNPSTGKTRLILTEENSTFVAGLDFIIERWARQFTLLKNGNTFLWMSERDGWRHLYLYDMNGKLIKQLTKGNFPVLEPIKTDEKAGWIYFRANAEPNLYGTQLYRINFEGKNFKRLTEDTGSHYFRFSPSGKYFLDAHSSPERSPVVELRDADGKLLQILKRADKSELEKIGWIAPENFIVKAADGVTDLYGIIYKPYNFNPKKKYPVIDYIYGGAFTTIVPRGFIPTTSLSMHAQALAQLGYITFLVDGRGTPERSKAFQDVIYGNIGKYEIPDHMAALKQLAAKYSYIDLKRVGIYGHSWGGYFALRALLTFPDVYHVGIASAPGDITEGAEVNEPYMGLLKENEKGYEFASNINFASNLKGKLLFVHGTSDANAPFSVTVRMINALIKADKPYDLLLMPERDHFLEDEKYVSDAVKDYFEKNLKMKNIE